MTDIELLLFMVKNKEFCGTDYKIHVLKNIDLERCFSFNFFFDLRLNFLGGRKQVLQFFQQETVQQPVNIY